MPRLSCSASACGESSAPSTLTPRLPRGSSFRPPRRPTATRVSLGDVRRFAHRRRIRHPHHPHPLPPLRRPFTPRESRLVDGFVGRPRRGSGARTPGALGERLRRMDRRPRRVRRRDIHPPGGRARRRSNTRAVPTHRHRLPAVRADGVQPDGRGAPHCGESSRDDKLRADIEAMTPAPKAWWRAFGFAHDWREDGFVLAYEPRDGDAGEKATVDLAVKYGQGAITRTRR